MSASAAFAVASAANAAAASAAAHRARLAECRVVEQSFDGQTATTEQKLNYASCVQMLHPQPLSGGEVVIAKVFIVTAFVGAAVGCWWGMGGTWRKDFLERTLGALLGALGFPLLLAITGAAAAGIKFLFS